MDHLAHLTRKATWILSCLLISIPCSAPAQPGHHPARPSPGTILFKVTSPEHQNVSYLFGTHHAFGKAFFDTLCIANKALLACDLYIQENLNLPGEMAEDIINERKKITRWKKYTSKDDLAFLTRLFATSPTDFQKMTPTEMHVFLNRYYKQQVCLNRSPEDPSLSLDEYIGTRAREQGLKLFGLETTRDQIRLINQDVEGMPRRVHKRRLSHIIRKIRTGTPVDCEETDWYARMAVDYQWQEPCRNALMLTDRNDRWMAILSDLLEQHNCFIAVGLSHLMYECGLVSQLIRMGYVVTAIPLGHHK